jgi:urease accessory protein UreF
VAIRYVSATIVYTKRATVVFWYNVIDVATIIAACYKTLPLVTVAGVLILITVCAAVVLVVVWFVVDITDTSFVECSWIVYAAAAREHGGCMVTTRSAASTASTAASTTA